MSDRPGFDEVVGAPERPRAGAEAPDPAEPASTRTALGSRLDRAWARWMSDPRLARAWRWGGPALVLLVAALTRLVGLAHPQQLVFDETYYVKDAWTLAHLGYEAAWPDDADAGFAAGDPSGFTTEGSFIAHPPLGKWIIALGMLATGGGDPFGWRIGVAICGILLVALTMLTAHRVFRSTLLTVVAGGLLAIEGSAIVMSRVALLDTVLALFALLGAYLVLRDRAWARERLDRWMLARAGAGRHVDWGPALWWRPWLLAAGAAFGAAASVKWSGLYFLAVFAVATLVMDAVDRRRAGVAFWASGTIFKQAPVSFLLSVPIAAAVHLASWTGWFATRGGYGRDGVAGEAGRPWEGLLAWVPGPLQSWWRYQSSIYGYHIRESSPHGYESPAILWPFQARPTSMYYSDLGDGTAQTITGIANPLIWWAATAAMVFLVVRFALRRELPVGFALLGLLAGWAPWLLYPHRTMFQFYSIAYEPFLLIGLTAAIGVLLGSARDRSARRVPALWTVGVFLGLCLLMTLYFLPMWTGWTIPLELLRSHYWLRSWI
ncbi:dolichyl-phosphate-mannose--protein mannosyltransferase [Homoserinibacter sp. YIM 151385]|uniref:dolichyl-phosphate-mannose--protein mannosyltransferase n=1 Tax=Homoserinibacter sp. YIM 151385 TaxID=2985506 RepID=UPI0022EFF9C8|nr:phospholipid carrier-dependent glycosyltransferase [Homoserinibacter sp. YIM 151385]WBU37977.1 phospholipid carrier-dependent glycosyltransferase [Homoserinibacter sp. YIM 151385]